MEVGRTGREDDAVGEDFAGPDDEDDVAELAVFAEDVHCLEREEKDVRVGGFKEDYD